MKELLEELISDYNSNTDSDFVEKNRQLFRNKGILLDASDKFAFLDYLASRGSDVFFLMFCEETNIKMDLDQAENYSSVMFTKIAESGLMPCNKVMQQRLSNSIIRFPDIIGEDCVDEYYSYMFEFAIKNGFICAVQALLSKDKEKRFINDDISCYEDILNAQTDKLIERSVRNYYLTGEVEDSWENYVEGYHYTPDTSTKCVKNEDYFKTRGKEICKENLKSYKKSKLLSSKTTLEELNDFVDKYNWDDGFEIPYFIMKHKNCDLALRKKLYELGAGDCIDENTYKDTNKDPWKQFILELDEMIKKEEQ